MDERDEHVQDNEEKRRICIDVHNSVNNELGEEVEPVQCQIMILLNCRKETADQTKPDL